MTLQRIKLIAMLFALTWNFNFAQEIDTVYFSMKEDSLLQLYKEVLEGPLSSKMKAESGFRDSLTKLLKDPDSFYYTFPKLSNIGRISSEDGFLNIFSWNIPQTGGLNSYYAILQYCPKKSKEVFVYPLQETITELNNNTQTISSKEAWVASLYYQIVTTKYKGQVYYTLLGFHFNNILSNIKIIDVLAFNDNSEPFFPKQKFLYEGKPCNRIVFEYNERAQMALEYNETMEMIVFDHLSPARPSLTGEYQFYGPDFSYDALNFEEGIWKHLSDVQITY